jgi:hypothetical protein
MAEKSDVMKMTETMDWMPATSFVSSLYQIVLRRVAGERGKWRMRGHSSTTRG